MRNKKTKFRDILTLGTEMAFVQNACRDHPEIQELLLQDQRRFESQLRGPRATPLEKVLIRRIGVCQMALNLWEQRLAELLADKASAPATVNAAQRAVHQAHSRYLSAIRSLTHLQKFQSMADPGPSGPDASQVRIYIPHNFRDPIEIADLWADPRVRSEEDQEGDDRIARGEEDDD